MEEVLSTKIAGVAPFVSRAALRYATGRFLPLSRSWQFSCPSPEDNRVNVCYRETDRQYLPSGQYFAVKYVQPLLIIFIISKLSNLSTLSILFIFFVTQNPTIVPIRTIKPTQIHCVNRPV